MIVPPLPAPLPAAPDAAFAPGVAPRLGAYAGSLDRAGLAALVAPGLRGRARRLAREKRWLYALAATDEVIAAAAIVLGGWFAGAFAWAVDRRTGAVLLDRSAAGLPGVSAAVDDRPGAGARARFDGRGLSARMARDGASFRLEVEARGARLDVTLDASGAPAPFVLVAPVPGGGARATQKAGALRASGALVAGGRAWRLDGGTGGVDATMGLLARETAWRWAFGTGRSAAGAPIAFNLAEGFAGVPDGDPGENAVFAGAAPARLPPVRFERDPGSPLAPWRVASDDGAVDLAFRPLAAHRERRELVVLRTRFVQVAGEFAGRVAGPDGRPVAVERLPGVVEDHWARW